MKKFKKKTHQAYADTGGNDRPLSDLGGIRSSCVIIHVVLCLSEMNTSCSGPNQIMTELVETKISDRIRRCCLASSKEEKIDNKIPAH